MPSHTFDKQRRRAAIFAACALLFAAAMLALSGAQLKWNAVGFHKQPGFWSVLSLIGMALFALALLLQPAAMRSAKYVDINVDVGDDGDGNSDSDNDDINRNRTTRNWRTLCQQWFGTAEYALYFLLYVYAVPRLGYLPSTLIALCLLMYRLGYRSARMQLTACLVGASIVVLFKSLLQVKIPGGALYEMFPSALRNFLTLYL